MSAGFIGIVTGSAAEAAAAAVLQAPRFRIVVSAADPQRARHQALAFVRQGAVGLVSLGLCGALDPALKTGDVIRTRRVQAPDSAVWNGDDRGDALYGSDSLITSVAEKKALFSATGAAAVDMESHAVAAAAGIGGIPFQCLRVVADDAATNLPRRAASLLDDRGRTRSGVLLAALLAEPAASLAMMRSGVKALRALKRAAEGLSAEPLFGL